MMKKLFVAVLVALVLPAFGQMPPMPPGFKPTRKYVKLQSPKGAEQLGVTMARAAAFIAPAITISNTCSIRLWIAGQYGTTNVIAWTLTAKTGSGIFYIDTSTNLVNWTTVLSHADFCFPMPGTEISLTGYYMEGNQEEKVRYFRNRTE